ncbi:MAG: hypothetical protein SGI88_05885 [Candidatus Hydrogenedentes bacterium]|nr:hypothetical protein [Candidatus Hydrogenedentota bacterium]
MQTDVPDLTYRFPLWVRLKILVALLLVPAYHAIVLLAGAVTAAASVVPLVAAV